jgi:thiamine monophosphate synthase
MARFRSNKRAKELQRKAKHEAKEARKKERQEKAQAGVDDDIDWSQAVGIDPPPGSVPADDQETEDAGDESEGQ